MAAAIALAVAIDLAFGDPPNRWHPVAWIGRLMVLGRRVAAAQRSALALLVSGAILVSLCSTLAGFAGWFVSGVASEAGWAGVILEAIGLKLAISIRDLVSACRVVAGALLAGDLPEARRLVGHHLVSRPTAQLEAAQVASATVESVGENLTDAVVAPLVFYLAFGLAGAYVYRTINTADAMFGYREGDLEYFGKTCARLDDIFNWIPARISALAIVCAAAALREDASGAWETLVRDHRKTASPNAGWTMAALAGALGVSLEKPGSYRLGDGPSAQAADIERGIRIVFAAA